MRHAACGMHLPPNLAIVVFCDASTLKSSDFEEAAVFGFIYSTALSFEYFIYESGYTITTRQPI